MAVPVIPNGSKHFYNVTYVGNGTGQRVGNFVPFTDNGTIANSCIFEDGDTPKLARTPSSTGSRRTFTFSAWIKRGNFAQQAFFSFDNTSPGGGGGGDFRFDSSHRLQIVAGGGTTMNKISTRTFEDTSKFYHIVVRVDTTQSTAADRVRIYVDGDQITVFTTNTIPSQNADFNINTSSYESRFGSLNDNGSLTSYFDGYMAEVNFADGQSYGPDTFGITDTSTGRWIPKSLTGITYGTNGFRFQFANSAGQTIGDDTSGNGNDFAVTNLAVTDITTDSPTQNFNNMGGDKDSGASTSEGNLKAVTPSSGGGYNQIVGLPSFGVSTGKWYWEARIIDNNSCILGWKDDGNNGGSQANVGGGAPGNISGICCGSSGSFSDGELSIDTGYSGPDLGTTNNNDIFMFALDLDNQRAYIGQNGSWLNSDNPATPTAGVGGLSRIGNGFNVYPAMARLDNSATAVYNFGQNPSFSGGITAAANTASSGPGLFKYTPPTDYKALCQDNLPEAKNDFADWVWIKNRSQADGHQLFDSNRGVKKIVNSSSNGAEATNEDGLVKFLNGGCEIEDHEAVNSIDENYVSWNWHANGGTTAANTDGSGATLTSTVQANQDAGFSIVTYAGSSSGSKTVAHGLTEIPEMIWIKNRTDSSRNWFVYHKNASYASMVPYDGNAAYYMLLNSSNARDSGNVFNNTAPTNKIFHIQDAGSLNTNGSGKNYIAYVFHSVAGFSKIGLYKGNGSANGPYVYTGFKPSFLLVKCLSPSGRNWILWDNKRSLINPCDNVLYPDLTQAETTTGNDMDFLSNGFKPRGTNSNYNESSRNYTYMAFAEHPFIGDGTNPVTAR